MKRVLAVLLSAVLSLSVAVVPGIQDSGRRAGCSSENRRAAGGRGGSTGTKCRFDGSVYRRCVV